MARWKPEGRKPFTLYIDEKVYEKITHLAHVDGLSIQRYLNKLIREHTAHNEDIDSEDFIPPGLRQQGAL